LHLKELALTPQQLSGIITLVDTGKVSHTRAVDTLLPEVIKTGQEPEKLIEKLDIALQTNTNEIEQILNDIFARYPDKVQEYKKGKKGLLGLFVGEVMKATRGKSDPKTINQLIVEKLEKI
jgi:Asp-tRNAAsn/Glu-tRNAGln amidotransferase B subunit (PET112 homolog)